MKKFQYILYAVICYTILISGCKERLIPSPTLTPTLSQSSLIFVLPTPSLTPKITFLIATPRPTVTLSSGSTITPSPASPPKPSLEQNCIKLSPSLPREVKVDNRIVLAGYRYLKDSYILNVMSGDKTILGEKGGYILNLHISPKGNWLAYRNENKTATSKHLIIASGDGKEVVRMPWVIRWRQISGWLDDERLWISLERPGYVNDGLMLFNPYTSEHQEFPADYPDAADKFPSIGWGSFDFSAKVYDPTLSRVVYPSGVDKLILWDTEANKQISVVENTISINGPPTWSPDGLNFLIKNDENGELYVVSRDGIEKQLTHLRDYFSQFDIKDYSWSPNGGYIAFGLFVEQSSYPDYYPSVKPQGNTRLAVLDLATNQVTDYCVPNHNSGPPVWLPNSQQLVVENHPSRNEGNVYFIDLTVNLAVKIADNASPVGWLEVVPTTQP